MPCGHPSWLHAESVKFMSRDVATLSAKQLRKSYDGALALDGVDFEVERGKSVALIGANGAGKSTLVRLLTGAIKPDQGEIFIDGELIKLRSVGEARKKGIGFVPQELCISRDLSVAENVLTSGWGRHSLGVSHQRDLKRVTNLCELIGLKVSASQVMFELSPAEQRIVMIVRSLIANPKTLILDEPTSALADREAERILQVLNNLRSQGLSVVYISHRMGEISRVCDSLVALRGGRVVAVGPATPENVREAIALSVNKSERAEVSSKSKCSMQKLNKSLALDCFEISNSRLKNVSLHASTGEVVGLCGLLGSGRTEILRVISGADRLRSGKISVFGESVVFKSPADAAAVGVGLLPEDRRSQGVLADLSVRDNLTLAKIPHKIGFLALTKEKRQTENAIKVFGVQCLNLFSLLLTLSGGNQQKVVFARWIFASARILLLDEPTAGIDVSAKKDLLELVRLRVEEGLCVVIASSEFEDLTAYCDRIYIVKDGSIIHEIVGGSTVEQLTNWCNI